jgi:hypothetical protein
MRRLTISGHACVETLALLVTMAWADGRLDDAERAGVRGAADVFNLSKQLRERLDLVLQKPMELDLLLLDTLSPRDRAFAYVAAAWMSGVDEDVDEKETELLDQLGDRLGFDAARKAELELIAREMPAHGKRSPARPSEARDRAHVNWSEEVIKLFKAIPPRLEREGSDEFEVTFE